MAKTKRAKRNKAPAPHLNRVHRIERDHDQEHIERCLVRLGVQLRIGNREAALRIIDEAFSPAAFSDVPITRDTPLSVFADRDARNDQDAKVLGMIDTHGVLYVGQLLAMSDASLMLIDHIGPKQVERIDAMLADVGLVRDCRAPSG